MLKKWSTDQVAKSERLDYWAEMVCQTLLSMKMENQQQTQQKKDFYGELIQKATGLVSLVDMKASSHRSYRLRENIQKDDKKEWLVLFQDEGICGVEQDGHYLTAKKGDILICDTTRPYTVNLSEHFSHQILVVPYALLGPVSKLSREIGSSVFSTDQGAGYLLKTLFYDLLNQDNASELVSSLPICESLVSLLYATIHNGNMSDQLLPNQLGKYHLSRIRAFVLEHLTEDDLNIEQISRAVNLSARHIHFLFRERSMGVMEWVWHERVKLARHMLISSEYIRRSISEVAFACGFKTLAHFSRLFKKYYDMSPKEFKEEWFKAQEKNQKNDQTNSQTKNPSENENVSEGFK